MNLAIIIAIGGLILGIVNSFFIVKTYKKNRRLEFLQRKDHLSQKISSLNDRNTEFHLISARFVIVAVKSAGLPLQGNQAEQNTDLIASIKKLRDDVENDMKLWHKNIERLHVLNSNLTLDTDAPKVETMIDIVQVASDNLKKAIEGYSSTLHTLEATNDFIKTNLIEADEKIRKINIEADEKIKQINIDFDRAMEKLKNKE